MSTLNTKYYVKAYHANSGEVVYATANSNLDRDFNKAATVNNRGDAIVLFDKFNSHPDLEKVRLVQEQTVSDEYDVNTLPELFKPNGRWW